MFVNTDYSQRVVVSPRQQEWSPSPVEGVERIMLERMGKETGLATSLVRYAPGAGFYTHVHSGGEEFLVLSGSFHDEHGDYPAGYYVRNPIGSSHAPWAGPNGALLFVKLHQFSELDNAQCILDTNQANWLKKKPTGMSELRLHHFNKQETKLIRIDPNQNLNFYPYGVCNEILVLEGRLRDGLGDYPKGSWIRNPRDYSDILFSGPEGAAIYLKSY